MISTDALIGCRMISSAVHAPFMELGLSNEENTYLEFESIRRYQYEQAQSNENVKLRC